MTLREQWTLEGEQRGKLDVARTLLLKKHYSLSETQELTGLSLEVLKQLQDQAKS